MDATSAAAPGHVTSGAAVALCFFLYWFAIGVVPAGADTTFTSAGCFDIDRDRSPSHRDIAEPFDLEVNHRQRIADCRARLPKADASRSAELHLTMARYHYLLEERGAMEAELLRAARYGSLEARYWRAIGLIARGDAKETALGRSMIESAATEGSPHANMLLGAERASRNPHDSGQCERAVAELRVASRGGLTEAHYHLGTLHMHGACLDKDVKKALVHLSRVTGPLAHTARFAVALTATSAADTATVTAGLRQLDLLADEGFGMARVQLVTIYFGDDGDDDLGEERHTVPRDPAKARKHYCLLDDTFRSIARINIGDVVDQWLCDDPL